MPTNRSVLSPIWPTNGTRTLGPTFFQTAEGKTAVSKQDVLAYRDELQRRAAECANAGLMVQAAVWEIAADMCRAM